MMIAYFIYSSIGHYFCFCVIENKKSHEGKKEERTTQPSGTHLFPSPRRLNFLLDPTQKVLALAEHPQSQHGDGSREQALDRPLGTLRTVCNLWSLSLLKCWSL